MSARSLSDLFSIGLDVLKTTLSTSTNLIVAQLGNVVTSVATSDDAEWWQHVGFASRPRKPDAGSKAAQVVTITRSDHDAVIASRDDRAASIYASLDDGETAVFSSVAGGGVAVFKKDGSISVTNGAASASVTINSDGTANVYGSTVNVGDGAATSLAMGAAFAALWNELKGCAAGLDAAAALAGTPNVPLLVTFFTVTHPLDKLQTTKAKGT